MAAREVEKAETVESGLPVSPSMGPALAAANMPIEVMPVDRRVVLISVVSMAVAAVAALVAQGLIWLIGWITNICFHNDFSIHHRGASPVGNHLGWWVVLVPAAGGVLVGFMARYGSKAIRGHGIPEAMEQVLLNESRVPARITFLKPLSAAIAIGTGGPFGAEGPIIATGGALGSVVGQIMTTTATERKILLAAGAAAGMAATFGSPVSAVLLAIELLLFEFRARSIIPVALASATAAGVRAAFDGMHPMFNMTDLVTPGGEALALYILVGAIVGVFSVLVTRVVYWIEDGFEELPIHWMWWPALGGLAVGLIGYFQPRTLGVGYTNISDIVSNNLTISVVATLVLWKFISWAIALGSGTSGGTLAPLFTIGGGLGALIGFATNKAFPGAGIDLRIAALVGMASIFAGASRALLTSTIFAFETTLQPLGLLPLLGGCTASLLVSSLLMRNTIMTEKIERRGVRVPAEYEADFLDQVRVREMMTKQPVTLASDQTIAQIREWMVTGGETARHQGFPIVDSRGILIGILTRRILLDPETKLDAKLGELLTRPPTLVYADSTLRDAADHMVKHDVGRLPVIERGKPGHVIGMITRSDLLAAHRRRLRDQNQARQTFPLPQWRRSSEPNKKA